MLRSRFRWSIWGTLGLACTALAVATLAHSDRPASQDGCIVASPSSNPLSCKPSPPIVVTLQSSPALGQWVAQLEALEAVPQARVMMGGRQGGSDVGATVVWQGSLAQGEKRTLHVGYAAPAGANEIWVEAAAVAGPDAIRRGRAVLAIVDGKATPQIALDDAARVVLDPSSGLKVAEYRGTSEAGR